MVMTVVVDLPTVWWQCKCTGWRHKTFESHHYALATRRELGCMTERERSLVDTRDTTPEVTRLGAGWATVCEDATSNVG